MIKGDEPIQKPEDDLLGRADLAAVIAGEIRNIDASEGFVVGVLGPWGSGKTSLINLVQAKLGEEPSITVLTFNPWMFSGADQLVESFFNELAAQLRAGPSKLQSIGEALDAYGEIVAPLGSIPVVGTPFAIFGGATKAVGNYYKNRKKGVAETRNRLSAKLRELSQPIVVVIDDVDRLRTNEIRDIFKLIRLTANLPNVIYLVAFDRLRVEKALAEDGLPGRDYLEKIIQAAHNIPSVPESVLTRQITGAMNEALSEVPESGPFEEDRWPDIFIEVVRPLFQNMRDVRRYAASLPGTVRSLGGQVALVDVLALEAIRVFLPDLFAAMEQNQDALTDVGNEMFSSEFTEPKRKAQIDAILEAAGERKDLAEAMINRMFPAAIRHLRNESYGSGSLPRWLRDRRVANPDVLTFYLQRVAGERLQAHWSAEKALSVLSDREQLEALFQSMEPSMWEDVISSLEAFQEDFPEGAAAPATIALLNLLPEIPDRPRSLFDLDSRIVVQRVVLRLLRRLPTPEAIEIAVRTALPELQTFTGKLILLNLVGHEENVGHELITQEASQQLESSLRQEIREANPEVLALEPDIFRVLFWTKKSAAPSESPFELPTDVVLRGALLKGAVGRARSQGVGTRAIRVEKELRWDALVELIGSEEEVRRTVEVLRNQVDDQALVEAVQLAEKYLDGWRPSRYSR